MIRGGGGCFALSGLPDFQRKGGEGWESVGIEALGVLWGREFHFHSHPCHHCGCQPVLGAGEEQRGGNVGEVADGE